MNQQEELEFEEIGNDNCSNSHSELPSPAADADGTSEGNGNGNDLAELKLKMATLEAKVAIVERKCDKMEEEKIRRKSMQMEILKMANNEMNKCMKEYDYHHKWLLILIYVFLGAILAIAFMALKDVNISGVDFQWSQIMEKIETYSAMFEWEEKYNLDRKQIANPSANRWASNEGFIISSDGLNASDKFPKSSIWLFAEKAFPIVGGEHVRKEGGNHFLGTTILYYFEITQLRSWSLRVGLSDGSLPDYPKSRIGECGRFRHPNTYAIDYAYLHCFLSDKGHFCEWPNEFIKSAEGDGQEGVVGCGLLLNSQNNLAIFFTVNGILIHKPRPIKPTVDRLYPTLTMMDASIEANFGDNPANPFKYDIDKCPAELVFECNDQIQIRGNFFLNTSLYNK